MNYRLDPPLTPRNGQKLRILAVCRISTVHQDAKALADQEALLRRYLADHYNGQCEWKVFSSTGSGEVLDRKELVELEDLIESRLWDLVLTEDLGRITRRHRSILICEAAEDCGTRLIALNDHVDTGRDGWRTSAVFATIRHELYNKDTSNRICRSQRNRFSNEGLIQTVQYGYIKPPGVKTDVLVSKDPAAEPIYDEWFRLLEDGASFSEIVDFLVEKRVAPGPWVRSGRWSVAVVRNATYNPILKGVRVHNMKKSARVNKTGRHRSVHAPPEERLTRSVPHLAFIDTDRYDQVVARVKARNANKGRKPVNGSDPRKGVPKKRTAWPGQHARCGVCGRLFYHGGDGRPGHLMCSGARDYRCWVGTTFEGPLAAERIARAVFAEVMGLPEFDAAFLESISEQIVKARQAAEVRDNELAQLELKLARQIKTTTELLIDGATSQALREKLSELESERDLVVVERKERLASCRPTIELPSMDQIKSSLAASFGKLTRDSDEFNRLMTRLVPRLNVKPYRPIDGGNIDLRAHLTVELASLAPEMRGQDGAWGILRRELVVDLFDPPQRVAHLARVRELTALAWKHERIADDLGITKTAVQRTAVLAKKLDVRGLVDPYEPVLEPPDDSVRQCRHRHPRYQFEPLCGIHTPNEVRDSV